MVGNLLLRGMLAGAVAGILAFCFAEIFGEPQIDRAIAFEEQMAQAAGEMTMPELVSRPVQSGIGLFTGVVVYGAAMGGLLALAFAYVQGRFSHLRPRATSLLLALGAFFTVAVVPSIKYPANPPSIGHPDTIVYRTELFLAMLVASVVASVLAVALARRLQGRYGAWNAYLIAGAAFVAGIAITQIVLPSINEVPDQFSAVVLWRFRLASLGIQLVVWATIGLLFGPLTERGVAPPFRSIFAGWPISRRPMQRSGGPALRA
jgi:Probable cobalt transporter subunit (CbtA)